MRRVAFAAPWQRRCEAMAQCGGHPTRTRLAPFWCQAESRWPNCTAGWRYTAAATASTRCCA
ncbi:hypothetical protein KHF85_11570 [Xanthomonas translucens pv. graminis]|uniref:hypothetical protein n=1 Tax=Xanthomonas graminis TaxID=3390026 RepID=UPI0025416CA1|nr:hypothetical protein [Xanthomonas translucens]WIH03554.1 hypothetical protein KHF85_11570 [Xanthomonas translucens pv. graminis]